jgi:TrmH RNA methyltransferase
MAHHEKRDPRKNPNRPQPTARPTLPARPRGATDGPDEFAASSSRPEIDHSLPGSRSGPARDELRICGLSAVRARFARDPDSILRLFFDYETGRKVGVISKVLAQKKKIYRCVEAAELEKVAGTVHHGGIVAVVAAKPLPEAKAADAQSWAKRREPLLLLDRIGNAHNLGAIARTAAFFGVPRVLLPEDAGAAKPNDAAYRVAEGGLESVEVWRVARTAEFVRTLAMAGYDVVGAATRGGRPDAGTKRGPEAKPLALVLGNEEHGLAPDVATACTRLLTIPGRGDVESLNVSVAAAVLMWELFARRER